MTGGVSSGDNAQTLTAMANVAIVRQLQERARASLVGSAMGAEVYHIGSPTGQPGSDFQSVRSHSTQSYSHPTASPVSSGSAVPGGAMSSPGRMSDIEGTSFCASIPPLIRKLGTRILLPPALLSKQQDSPQLPQWIVNPFRTTQAHQTRSVLFT